MDYFSRNSFAYFIGSFLRFKGCCNELYKYRAYFLCFHIFQGKEVDEYIAAGGLVVNTWWLFIVAIEGLLGSFLLLYFSEYLYTNIPVWFFPGRY